MCRLNIVSICSRTFELQNVTFYDTQNSLEYLGMFLFSLFASADLFLQVTVLQ